jgi:hypothetical protein
MFTNVYELNHHVTKNTMNVVYKLLVWLILLAYVSSLKTFSNVVDCGINEKEKCFT